MNIVIGKIGKSVKFNKNTWGATGGPNEAPLFFANIARLNPQNTYYLIGHSDFSRLPEDIKKEVCPNNNIIDIWKFYDKKTMDNIKFPYEYLTKNNINISYGLIYAGSVAGVNLPNTVYKKDKKTGKLKDEYVGVLETYKNYAAPLVYYFNNSNIKYMTLCPDPRYIPLRADDILNPEKISLAMKNEVKEFERMKSFDNQTEREKYRLICKYSGIETVFLMDKQVQKDLSKYEKTKKLVIFHNEGGVKELDRGKVLTEYILNNFPEAEIYGKWKDEWLQKDNRFKGALKFADLQNMLPTVKYTFMVPIEKDTVSMKFWESVHNNIIPFMHKYYDTSRYLKCPEFIRIESPEDLVEKIQYLEDNPVKYEILLKKLKSMITPDMYNGEFINNQVNKSVNTLLSL